MLDTYENAFREEIITAKTIFEFPDRFIDELVLEHCKKMISWCEHVMEMSVEQRIYDKALNKRIGYFKRLKELEERKMYENLYQAKRKDTQGWIRGYYYSDGDRHYIMKGDPLRFFEIIPKTVGQYTGLQDKNGKKIFEGDIVRLHYFFEAIDGGTLGVYESENEVTACIKIDKYGVWFQAIGVKLDGYLCDYIEEPEEELEVIGNIHDNPELLEGEKSQ